MRLAQLRKVLGQCWTKETSFNPRGWDSFNPSSGQCRVTTLVVQDFFGGQILEGYMEILEPSGVYYKHRYYHYWNLLPDGQEVDLTKSQFPQNTVITKVGPEKRSYLLSHGQTKMGYRLLKLRVRKFINKNHDP